jgi:hypothetical protein
MEKNADFKHGRHERIRSAVIRKFRKLIFSRGREADASLGCVPPLMGLSVYFGVAAPG